MMKTVAALVIGVWGAATIMGSAADTVYQGLIGHWTLDKDFQDVSDNHLVTQNRGVSFGQRGAGTFSGRGALLEVADTPALNFGIGDFSVAAWANLDQTPDDALGDIVSKYDPVARRGFHVSVLNLTGVTSSHSNYRTLHFGIDNAREPAWADCGRPGNNLLVCALTVFDDNLYAGTFEAGEDEAGHVYRYDAGDRWVDCGAPDPCNAVATLAVYQGKLYAGVARYKAGGSALPDSPNQHPGGKVYRYEGGNTWVDCGRLGDADTAWAMAVHDGVLYAIPIYQQGMWRYDGGRTWTYCGTPGVRLMALGVFDGRLYGAGNEGNKQGGVYRYEGGTDWTLCGRQTGVDQVYSFAAYEGRLYAGTWPDATAFRYDGGETWPSCGRLGQENEVMAMAVYNGKLYAGSLPLAEVYRYDSGATWTRMARLDMTPDVKYRRVWSMAVFQGKLFCGTLPSGRVYSMEAGANVTYDRALGSGWRHVAAARQGGRLILYVDGTQVGTSPEFDSAEFDLTCASPLRIGLGAHDYFNGWMRDVRIYNRALEPSEAAALAAAGKS
jgi:hypothetical protein